MIVLDRVGVTYQAESGPVEALRDVGFGVGRGELLALVGPSGCGKSTLLRVVAGLRRPTHGAVEVDGRVVTGPIPAVGMVFQAPVLLRWRTVRDNVLLPAELAGLERRRYRERADYLLRLVGLGGFADRLPRELSGGMQQRAAICRALLLDPPLLLMDEPFGALDEIVRDHLNEQLLKLWAKTKKTAVFVTHSIPEAVFLSSKIVVMSPRPGRIIDIIDCDFPRDRTLEIRETPEFLKIAQRVRVGLRAGHSYDE